MSGIYLIVWDELMKEKSFVLQSTKGGYPHCTLCYTGANVSKDKLIEVSNEAMKQFSMREMTLSLAYVNSFRQDDGIMRHDVLMEVKETVPLENFRQKHIYGLPNAGKIFTGKLHVTHGIFGSKEEAEERVLILNEKLPRTVIITGVTIE